MHKINFTLTSRHTAITANVGGELFANVQCVHVYKHKTPNWWHTNTHAHGVTAAQPLIIDFVVDSRWTIEEEFAAADFENSTIEVEMP